MFTFSKPDHFWDYVSVALFQARESIETGPFKLAMSGGSALQLLDQLTKRGFAWNGVEVYVVDERCVPLDHPDSNSGQIQALLSDTAATLHLFDQPENRQASMAGYAHKLSEIEGDNLFDFTILGVGPDGHVASLFPNSAALESGDLVVQSETDVFAVRERMGLSFDSIERSKNIMVLMIGAVKSDIFYKLQESGLGYLDFPALRILETKQSQAIWLNN